MEITYFTIAASIAALFVFFKYRLRRSRNFILPSTIFMLMWMAAIIASIISQVSGLDEFGMGYSTTAPYLLLFIMVSMVAFFFARFFIKERKRPFSFDYRYVDYLLSKFKVFIYLSFLLGLLRIAIIISSFGFDSLYDYRQNAFVIGGEGGLYGIVTQISSYVYALATLFIVLLAIRHALTSVNFKEMGWYFVLFAAQALSIGGRMFIIDFISCYFFMFLLIRSGNPKIFRKSEMAPFVASLFALLSIVMIFGVLRNDRSEVTEKVTSDNYYSKFLYLQDGIVYTSVFFNKMQYVDFELDYGKNLTSIDRDNTSFARFRNRPDMEMYLPFVTGAIIPLVFDFGYTGSLVVWFFVCLLIEIVSIKAFNRGTILAFFLVFILLRYLYDTPLLVVGGRGFFRYLFVLFGIFLLHKSKYFLTYRHWLARMKKRAAVAAMRASIQ